MLTKLLLQLFKDKKDVEIEKFWEYVENTLEEACGIDPSRIIYEVERGPIKRGRIIFTNVLFLSDMENPIYIRTSSSDDIEEGKGGIYNVIARVSYGFNESEKLFNRTDPILINDKVRGSDRYNNNTEEIVIRVKRRPVVLVRPIKSHIWLVLPFHTRKPEYSKVSIEDLEHLFPIKFHYKNEDYPWSNVLTIYHLAFIDRQGTFIAQMEQCLLDLILKLIE